MTPPDWDAWEAFFTPGPVAEQGLRLVSLLRRAPANLLDLGAGAGVFGQRSRLVWPRAERVGVEVRPTERAAARHYSRFLLGDWSVSEVRADAGQGFDLVVSNPPFSRTREMLESALEVLAPRGLVLFFVRASWGLALHDYDFIRRHAPTLQADVPGRVTLRRGRSARGHELNGDLVGHKWLVFSRRRRSANSWPTTLLPPLPGDMRRWTVRPGTEARVEPLPSFFHPQPL